MSLFTLPVTAADIAQLETGIQFFQSSGFESSSGGGCDQRSRAPVRRCLRTPPPC